MPSDLGYSDEKYILPELIKNNYMVKNQSLIDGQIQMFKIAKTMTEVRQEQTNDQKKKRCQKAFEAKANNYSLFIG